MSNSLRDQLLKAGLVNEKQAKQVARKQKKEQKLERQGLLEKEVVAPAGPSKADRDRELMQQRQAEQRKKEGVAQARQMIEQHQLSREGGEQLYRFTHGTKIKQLYVTAEQQDWLSRGRLAVVQSNGQYQLVPAPLLERLRPRDESCVVSHHAPKASDEDDPYKDFVVPDDLMW
ncbi:DUF2058 domain-containing protein [Atopomonas sediminilitoris]|uniref:DUF2058 domain-containing protein n=1 Tax=Atopomonas sediminilitoris TaxID=2919919 RepID=UPI001F4EC23C|nr:DUF2058 domain-containing protein [Atopomonas sediminilitoris]MCJ8167977.1 DUF2058 domain-containing protein [Atopomonas sediminilitoris]